MPPSTTFGASIVTPVSTNAGPIALDSPALTPAVSTEDLQRDLNGNPVPPHSPFYQHPPASFEKIQTHSRQGSRVNIGNEKDLEAGAATPLAPRDDHPFASKVSVDCSKECRMWPSKQTLQQEQEERRKQEHSKKKFGRVTGPVVDFWRGSTKRQKLYMQIALALVLIGVIVAIAVGITVAVNGTVYVGEDRSKQIPEPQQ